MIEIFKNSFWVPKKLHQKLQNYRIFALADGSYIPRLLSLGTIHETLSLKKSTPITRALMINILDMNIRQNWSVYESCRVLILIDSMSLILPIEPMTGTASQSHQIFKLLTVLLSESSLWWWWWIHPELYNIKYLNFSNTGTVRLIAAVSSTVNKPCFFLSELTKIIHRQNCKINNWFDLNKLGDFFLYGCRLGFKNKFLSSNFFARYLTHSTYW